MTIFLLDCDIAEQAIILARSYAGHKDVEADSSAFFLGRLNGRVRLFVCDATGETLLRYAVEALTTDYEEYERDSAQEAK